jgi:hypothetical protein
VGAERAGGRAALEIFLRGKWRQARLRIVEGPPEAYLEKMNRCTRCSSATRRARRASSSCCLKTVLSFEFELSTIPAALWPTLRVTLRHTATLRPDFY